MIIHTNIVTNIPTLVLFLEGISNIYFQISNIGYRYSHMGFPFTNIDISVKPTTNENTTLGLTTNQGSNIGILLSNVVLLVCWKIIK